MPWIRGTRFFLDLFRGNGSFLCHADVPFFVQGAVRRIFWIGCLGEAKQKEQPLASASDQSNFDPKK